MEKPTLPKGTRDFGPIQMAKRQFIMDSIRKVFQKYGFQPLETPAMENLTTLTGKYGDEGDQLLFKVLHSGDFAKSVRNSVEEFRDLERKIRYEFNTIFLKQFNEYRGIDKSNSNSTLGSGIDDRVKQIVEKLLIVNKDVIDNALKGALSENHFIAAYNISNNLISNLIAPFLPDLDKLFDSRNLSKDLSEKGLRYDLTVPFARYVVMNRGEITFPFKRYQIQPVWRADRPQKGRYREFYQCDADVVGTNSLICEAEIILMIREVFNALNIQDYTIKVNHRGILSGLAESAGTREKESSLFVAIDKLDKIGEEKVREELRGKEFAESSLNTVFDILNFKGTTSQKIDFLTSKFASSEAGKKGISDFKEVLSILQSYGVSDEHIEFDIALARGLSYYTGCIFEVKINNVAIGSVSGGGRYDNLTKAFGDKENLSGVGFSFGVDRIYDAMEELKLFPQDAQISSKVLVCHFDEESKTYGLKVLQALREKGISSEIYPDSVKINKQLDYANKKMIPFTIMIGSNEVKSGVLAFKDMKKGEQQSLTLQAILDQFQNN